MIKNNDLIHYIGVTHEYINVPQNLTKSKLEFIKIIHIGDGNNKKNKFERDIKLLEKDLNINQNNSRNLFYLANSYYDIANYENALINYKNMLTLKHGMKNFYNYYRQGLCYRYLKNETKMVEYLIKHRIPTIMNLYMNYKLL